MAVQVGTSANFATLTSLPKIVIVDYWADWCSPCKQISPILDDLATQYADQIEVVKVDTNAQADLAAAQGVMSLPTLHFYSGGMIVKSLQGGQTRRQLVKEIESLI